MADAVEEYQALSVETKRMQEGLRALAEYFLEDPNTCEVRHLLPHFMINADRLSIG